MKQQVEIDIPSGYEFVRFGVVSNGEYYTWKFGIVDLWTAKATSEGSYVVLKKKQPARIIFEEVEDSPRKPCEGEWVRSGIDGAFYLCTSSTQYIEKHRVFIEAKE